MGEKKERVGVVTDAGAADDGLHALVEAVDGLDGSGPRPLPAGVEVGLVHAKKLHLRLAHGLHLVALGIDDGHFFAGVVKQPVPVGLKHQRTPVGGEGRRVLDVLAQVERFGQASAVLSGGRPRRQRGKDEEQHQGHGRLRFFRKSVNPGTMR